MAEPKTPVTVTVADARYFSVGDTISMGDWPHWCYRYHVPMWLRKFIKRIMKIFGKKFGPQYATITEIVDQPTIHLK